MAQRGRYELDNIDFRLAGATQVKLTASPSTLTYEGVAAANVVVTGVDNAATFVGVDSANKNYVATIQYDAIVDAGGNGTHTTLSAAVTAGASSIYIKSGTYSESSNIDFSANAPVNIVGENKYDTIIDFGSNDAGLILNGGGTPYITGTISIISGTTTVTGAGTAFNTNLVAGEYILLNDTFYEIDSVTNATSLELVNTYNGNSLTGEQYVGLPLTSGQFRNFTIQSSGSGTGNQLTLSSTIGAIVQDVYFKNSRNHAIAFNNLAVAASSTETLISNCIIDSPSNNGIETLLEIQGNFNQNIIKNVGNTGLNIDTCRNLVINGFNITDCGDDGVSISNGLTSEIILTDTVCDNNNGNGITITTTGNCVIVKACNFTNNNLAGVEILSSNNIIGDCKIEDNALDGISIGGSSNSNSITCNQIINNGAFGIDITTGTADNIISSNVVDGNTSGSINNPDGTTTANVNYTGNVINSVKDNAYLYGYDNTGGTAIAASPGGGLGNPVVFDIQSVAQTGLSLNTGTGVITITEAGIYEISYWVQCESLNTAGAPRTKMSAQIETDPAGGTAWVVIAGSPSSAYIREQGSGVVGYGCGKTVPIVAAAGETLRITFFRGTQTTTAQTEAGRSSIYIKRMGP